MILKQNRSTKCSTAKTIYLKTTQLMEELNGSDDINSFLSNNKDSLDRQDFARYLCELVKKKKKTKIEVKEYPS